MERQLLTHQKQALRYMLDHPSSNALLMEMRLGKTLVCIRANRKWNRKRILVVAPKTVLSAWAAELALEGELAHVIEGSPSQRVAQLKAVRRYVCPKRPVWFLVSYPMLRNFTDLSAIGWDWIILDESTAIKNPQAMITRVVNGRSTRSRYLCGFWRSIPRTILTGLIAPENPLEVFEQQYFLRGSLCGFKSFWPFRNALFHRSFRDHSWTPKPKVRRRIQEEVGQNAFVLSRKDAKVGPRKVHEPRYVQMPASVAKQYRATEDTFAYSDLYETLETKWAPVCHTWLGRLAGGFDPHGNLISRHKLDELLSLLDGELAGQQVVIWFHFNAELFRTAEELRSLGKGASMLFGALNRPLREAEIASFREGRTQYLCAQVAVASHGIDLSWCDTACYYSTSWSAERRAQSEDRIISPVAETPRLIIDLITSNTVDVDAYTALRAKTFIGGSFQAMMRKMFEVRRNRLANFD